MPAILNACCQIEQELLCSQEILRIKLMNAIQSFQASAHRFLNPGRIRGSHPFVFCPEEIIDVNGCDCLASIRDRYVMVPAAHKAYERSCEGAESLLAY